MILNPVVGGSLDGHDNWHYVYTEVVGGENSVNTTVNNPVKYIHFLTNDSETDYLLVTFTTGGVTGGLCTLAPYETINDIRVNFASGTTFTFKNISYEDSPASYRFAYSEEQ